MSQRIRPYWTIWHILEATRDERATISITAWMSKVVQVTPIRAASKMMF